MTVLRVRWWTCRRPPSEVSDDPVPNRHLIDADRFQVRSHAILRQKAVPRRGLGKAMEWTVQGGYNLYP